MSLSGKLLPTVYACLKESSGSFGPTVKKSVDEYAAKYDNVAITSSKSGKLTTALYKNFLTDLMKPYVQKTKFLRLIDLWGGQTNLQFYDEVFRDEEGLPVHYQSDSPQMHSASATRRSVFLSSGKELYQRVAKLLLSHRERKRNHTPRRLY